MLNKFIHTSWATVAACMLGYSGTLLADDADGLQQGLQQIEQQMLRAQQAHEQEIKSLRARISAMEDTDQQAQPASVQTGHTPIQVGLSSLFAAGGASVDNAALQDCRPARMTPIVTASRYKTWN